MADQLKIQTSVYLAQKMRSNSISTTASLDLNKLGMGQARNNVDVRPPIDRQNDQSESIEFEHGMNQKRKNA